MRLSVGRLSERFGELPQVVLLRYGGRDVQELFAYRMNESDAAGMQRDAAVAVRARGAVLQVAADRAADLRQLRPDLVVATGQQLDFEQVVMRTAAQ